MLVGAIGCGKTTFRQRIQNKELIYSKTQVTNFEGDFIDTPGEYLEHGHFNRALLLASYEADLILLMESSTAHESKYRPGFATLFPKPVLGLVTKVDIADTSGIVRAKAMLELAGVFQHFEISSFTGEGFDFLIPHLDRSRCCS